jgi:hypothetical protein
MLCRHVYIFHYLINSLLGVNAIKARPIKDVFGVGSLPCCHCKEIL